MSWRTKQPNKRFEATRGSRSRLKLSVGLEKVKRVELKSLLIQALMVGAAAGNVQVAPIIGQGSVFWFAFVLLMFTALATVAASFSRLLVVALLASPVLYVWQSVHRFQPSSVFLVVEFAYLLFSSQAAVACVLGYQKLQRR